MACSCGSQPDESFVKDGVSFTHPSDWSIKDQNDLDNGGFYMSVKKEGYIASGILTLTRINGTLDPNRYLEITQEQYKTQKVLNDLEFQSVQDYDFNGIPAISCDFKFDIEGLEHTGVVYVFKSGDSTYSIIRQEAIDDISKNKQGFDLIESTFKVE